MRQTNGAPGMNRRGFLTGLLASAAAPAYDPTGGIVVPADLRFNYVVYRDLDLARIPFPHAGLTKLLDDVLRDGYGQQPTAWTIGAGRA